MKRSEFLRLLGVSALSIGIAPNVFANKKCDEKICREAWSKLCGNIGKVYKNDAFKYVHPVKRRPNVFLYGDSVSIGYTPQVRKSLKGKATVFRLFTNGGSSRNFISNMDRMRKAMFQPDLKGGWDFKWDLIHFNVGLHDLKYLANGHLDKKNGKQVSSINEYKANLELICRYLKTNFPDAKLIFATTTPVPPNAKGRYEGDSLRYNQAAREVLVNYPDIVINDLYTITKPHQDEWAQEPGNVHFNEQGRARQGEEVARLIADNL